MFARTLFAILISGCFVVPSNAEEPPKYKPIDPEIVAAYKKLGGEYGGFHVEKNGAVWFSPAKEGPVTRAARVCVPGYTQQQYLQTSRCRSSLWAELRHLAFD